MATAEKTTEWRQTTPMGRFATALMEFAHWVGVSISRDRLFDKALQENGRYEQSRKLYISELDADIGEAHERVDSAWQALDAVRADGVASHPMNGVQPADWLAQTMTKARRLCDLVKHPALRLMCEAEVNQLRADIAERWRLAEQVAQFPNNGAPYPAPTPDEEPNEHETSRPITKARLAEVLGITSGQLKKLLPTFGCVTVSRQAVTVRLDRMSHNYRDKLARHERATPTPSKKP